MCGKNEDYWTTIGEIFLTIFTQGLVMFGCYSGNKMCIMFWFHEPDESRRLISTLHLTYMGLIHFAIFNFFCVIACITHLRAYFADPGFIPSDIEIPDYVDTVMLDNCEKCDMRWKPMRAHHCQQC